MFRPCKVSSNVHTGWMHGRGMTLNPRSCSQWMDPEVTLTRSTDHLWRNLFDKEAILCFHKQVPTVLHYRSLREQQRNVPCLDRFIKLDL